MRADVITHWFDDVVTAKNHEIESEPKPECADLFRLNVNNFGKKFSHAVTAALQAARTRRTATRLDFLFLPHRQNFRFAFRVSPECILIADLVSVT